MKKLIFIRHGETAKNIGKKLHALNDPEPLTLKGKEQILKTAKRLREFSPEKIYTSSENRAIESASIISKALNIPIQKIKNLQERNWGEFTSKPWSEIQLVLESMSFEQRYNFTPPSGESWKEFESRLIKVVEDILKENKDGVFVIIAHGGVIRALLPYLLNLPKEESYKYDPDNASLTIFDYDGKNFYQVTINDTSHLDVK